MFHRSLNGRIAGQRQSVELVLEDRVHALEVVCARPQAAPGRRFHALGGIAFRQSQNPQAGTVSHLRMALGRQDRFRQLTGAGSGLLGIFDQPRGRAPQVLLVRLGHVLGQRSGFPRRVGADMRRYPHAAVENFQSLRR